MMCVLEMSGLRVVSTLALFQGCGVESEELLEQVQHDFSFRNSPLKFRIFREDVGVFHN